MTYRGALVLWLLLLGACENAAPQPSRAAPTSPGSRERTFGAPFSSRDEPVDVARVLRDPRPFLQQTIKCSGTVARVCQAAGCWLELRAGTEGEGLRVPMAGHAFFVPQDVVGRPAVVEGRLAVRDLTEAELGHLRGEGLKATGPLFLEATGVAIR